MASVVAFAGCGGSKQDDAKQRREVSRIREIARQQQRYDVKLPAAAPRIDTEAFIGGLQTLRSGFVNTMKDLRKVMRSNQKFINDNFKRGTEAWAKNTATNYRAGISAVKKLLKRRVITDEEYVKRVRVLQIQERAARRNTIASYATARKEIRGLLKKGVVDAKTAAQALKDLKESMSRSS